MTDETTTEAPEREEEETTAHVLYLTFKPAPGTLFDAGFAERNRLADHACREVEGVEDGGGGTLFEPLRFDLDFTVPTPEAGAHVISKIVEALDEGWSIERAVLQPQSYASGLEIVFEGEPLELDDGDRAEAEGHPLAQDTEPHVE